MKESRFIALCFLGFGGALAVVGVFAYRYIGPYLAPEEYVFDNGRDLPANISGRWDWSTRGTPCADSAHVISFAPDAKVMTITQEKPSVDSTGRDWTVSTYDVVSIEPSRIRGQIRGETRLAEDGTPVVWDLVVVGPDEYRWRAVDWPELMHTLPVIRCHPPAGGPG
jgi:hypothetical protein